MLSKLNMQEILEIQKGNKSIIDDASESILTIFKGLDRVSHIPDVLSNIFNSLLLSDKSIDNNILKFALNTHVASQAIKHDDNIKMLYEYCVENGYTEDNMYEYGSGDRTVCFIPSDKKKVLFFQNQNTKFVVVENTYKTHIRQVYDQLLEDESEEYYFSSLVDCDTVSQLRSKISAENGLEIAIANLMGEYSNYSNDVPGYDGNKHTLNTMKLHDFDKKCGSFTYGDIRDDGYILSYDAFMGAEVRDYNKITYTFNDILLAISTIPNNFKTKYERNLNINKIIE